MDQPTKPKFRIVSVERLDSYKDGGTLGVICWGYNGLDESGRRFEVTQDHQPNQRGLYEMWVGHPAREGSYKLTDPDQIQHVAEMVHQHIQHQIQRAEALIDRATKLAVTLSATKAADETSPPVV